MIHTCERFAKLLIRPHPVFMQSFAYPPNSRQQVDRKDATHPIVAAEVAPPSHRQITPVTLACLNPIPINTWLRIEKKKQHCAARQVCSISDQLCAKFVLSGSCWGVTQLPKHAR